MILLKPLCSERESAVLGRCYGEKNICNRFARMFMAEGEEELAGNASKMIQMAEERHDQQV